MLRLWSRLAVVLLVAAIAHPVLPAAAAPQDDLDAKRDEAAQIEREIDRNGERISILDEQYNQAQLAVETADNEIAQAETGLADAEARAEALRQQLATRAAQMYIGAGTGPLAAINSKEVLDIAARSAYGAAATERDQTLIDELGAAGEDLVIRRAELEEQRTAAAAQQSQLGAMRDEMASAQADQQKLLNSVEGDIATLVADIEAQRQREEEAKARAEFDRRAQAEAADRAARATTTTRPAVDEDDDGSSGDTAPSGVSAPNARAQIAVDTALAQLGKPYAYAGSGPDSFDCSGLTSFAWRAAGVTLPHSSGAQYAGLPHVEMSELAPGDLVFYGHPIHHVGVYIGNGRYVHAPQTGDVVKISSMYRSDYAGAARPG